MMRCRIVSGLIVGRMGSGDKPGAEPAGRLGEKPVSPLYGRQLRCRRTPAAFPPRRAPLRTPTPDAAQIDDQSLVFFGVWTQVVIQMGGTESALAYGLQRRHCSQQRHAIAPAGNGHKHGHVGPVDGDQVSASLVSSGWSMGQSAVGSGQWAVGSGQWAVGSGQSAVF